mmetsp:Transcript_80975/g.234733  ORF Transcript_80975/g.234733 Transcript_80975/m.234733 type:complete len:202 (+) Transcript_80975:671-1276(+)
MRQDLADDPGQTLPDTVGVVDIVVHLQLDWLAQLALVEQELHALHVRLVQVVMPWHAYDAVPLRINRHILDFGNRGSDGLLDVDMLPSRHRHPGQVAVGLHVRQHIDSTDAWVFCHSLRRLVQLAAVLVRLRKRVRDDVASCAIPQPGQLDARAPPDGFEVQLRDIPCAEEADAQGLKLPLRHPAKWLDRAPARSREICNF